MNDFEFEIWQDDIPIATTAADNRDDALREASHYMMMYGQDGPVELYEVKRERVYL